MAALSLGAARLLDDLARDHGVGQLAFDENGFIPMTIRDRQIAIAYSAANDSLFAIAVIKEAPATFDPWQALELSGQMASRRTRIAVEPESKALVLVGEILVEGLEYWRFLETLEAFPADYDMASAGAGGSADDRKPTRPPSSNRRAISFFFASALSIRRDLCAQARADRSSSRKTGA